MYYTAYFVIIKRQDRFTRLLKKIEADYEFIGIKCKRRMGIKALCNRMTEPTVIDEFILDV